MGKIESLTFPLTEDLATAIQSAVDSGDYASPAAVVDDALRIWRARREKENDRLRALIQEGIDSGPGQFETIEDLLAEARRRHAANKA